MSEGAVAFWERYRAARERFAQLLCFCPGLRRGEGAQSVSPPVETGEAVER